MGKTQQRAGGGKVTAENLTAANIKNGVTVSVKQGSKTVQQVTGSLKAVRRVVGSYSGSRAINVTSFLANLGLDPATVTSANFSFSAVSAPYGETTSSGGTNSHTGKVGAFSMSLNYSSGIVNVSGASDYYGNQYGTLTRTFSYTLVFTF